VVSFHWQPLPRKTHFAQAFPRRDFLGGFFSLAAAFRENTFCTSSGNWLSLGYIVWILWIRGATSQLQIVYLLLSLFCNEPNLIGLLPEKKSESMETPQNWMFYLEILQLAHLYRWKEDNICQIIWDKTEVPLGTY
jgi:hypothetical protein